MSSEEISLAPAAGSGVGRQFADALLADPDFLPLMKAALIGALRATVHVWDKDKRAWSDLPDFKTRLQALFGALAHMEGEPIKRIIHQHLGAGVTKTDLVAALQESPALAEAVERTLANARHHTLKPSRAQKAAMAERVGEDLDA